MKTWTLVLSLIGVTLASNFCYPERFTFSKKTSVPKDDIIKEGAVFDPIVAGHEVGTLPDMNLIALNAQDNAASTRTISRDLLTTPLFLKFSTASQLGAINHVIGTVDSSEAFDNGFHLTAKFKGVKDPAVEGSDLQYSVELKCGADAATTEIMYAYPDALKAVATADNWYVSYTFDENKMLHVSLSSDLAGLDNPANKLSTTATELPAVCISELEKAAAKAGGDGVLIRYAVGNSADKITLLYNSDAKLTSEDVVIMDQSPNLAYLLYSKTYPVPGDEDVTAYKFPSDSCVNTADYQFVEPQATDGVCPAAASLGEFRNADCKAVKLTEAATEDTCNTQYCCWYADITKCYAKNKPACNFVGNDLFDLSNNDRTLTKVEGTELTNTNKNSYTTIYLGEKVEFSCKEATTPGETNLLRYNKDFANQADFGDYTKVEFQCLANADNSKTTDFKAIFDMVKCEAACTKPTIHESVTITPDFTDDNGDPKIHPSGTEIKFTCKEGFGTSTGTTEFTETVACSSSVTDYSAGGSKKECYQCVAPGLDASVNAAFEKATVLPTHKVNLKCTDGYSFEKPKHDLRNVMEVECNYGSGTGATLEDVSDKKCSQDCKLKLPDNHGLKFIFDDEETTIESVPQDEEYELQCQTEGHLLEFGQADEIECEEPDADAAPAEITVKGCHQPCSIDAIKGKYTVETKKKADGAYSSVGTPTTEVALGTPIKLAGCSSSSQVFLFSEKDQNEFVCSEDTYDFAANKFKKIIDCYEKCELTSGMSDNYVAKEVVENDGDGTLTAQAVLDDMKLPPNTKVTFECKNTDETVEGTKGNIFTAECGTNGDKIALKSCYPSCQVNELDNPNKNTIVKSNTDPTAAKVAMGEHVDISCSGADYTMAFDTAKSKIEEYGECKLQATDDDSKKVLLEKTSTEAEGYCVAVPTVVKPAKTSVGPLKMTASVTLPADRDDTDAWKISELVVVREGDAEVCKITVVAGTDSYDCEITLSDATNIQAGVTLRVKEIKYDTKGSVTLPVKSVEGFYAGPPALGTGAVTISAVGKSPVTLTWGATLAADVAKYTEAGKYEPVYVLTLKKSTETLKTYEAKSITDLVATTSYDWSAELEFLSGYTVEIAASTSHGPGGKSSTSFKTGNDKATLTVSDVKVSSTSRSVTITLAASSVGGATQIKHQLSGKTAEVTEVKTFNEDKQYTIEFDDLTPLNSYTFTVTVLTDDGIPSQPASITFNQGPTKPKAINTGDIALTDGTAAISFEPAAGFTYRIKVYKKISEVDGVKTWSTDPVATYVYPEPADGARRRRDTKQTYTFPGLAGNTEYKVVMTSEGTVGGTVLVSDPVEMEFKTFACSKATLTAAQVAVSLPADAAVSDFHRPDENTVFTLTCPTDLVINEKDTATGALTKVTTQTVTCTASGWSKFTAPCVAVPEPTQPPPVTEPVKEGLHGGAIAGIVIGVIVFLLIVIILIICICRRGGGGGTENGTSQKYSPRDNEGEPDIGAKEANGDNVSMGSQTAKVELGDEEEAVEAKVEGETAEEKV